MSKQRSLIFWVWFWALSVVFLTGWYWFWETKNQADLVSELDSNSNLVHQTESEDKDPKIKNLFDLVRYFSEEKKEEQTFMVLFQNNLELRPGGGYLGTFGIVKVQNAEIKDISIHDLSNFDGRIPPSQEPPYPMKKTLRIDSWKLRDSNFSPDFSENAKKAEFFYKLGDGQEELDGVIGITANVLTSFLEVTGSIEIEGYPGTYTHENAILDLERQVEINYNKQGINKGERKSIMGDLAREIIARTDSLSVTQKLKLFNKLQEDLAQKDIQLFFKDRELQAFSEEKNWAGRVDSNWDWDYLMLVDANMGAFKSDYHVKRSFSYEVDLTQETPEAVLRVTYNHTAKERDFMTKDYLTYLRIYVPEGSWLMEYPGLVDPQFGEEFGKKYFGFLVDVPLGTERTIELHYDLPARFKEENYTLKIQKQAGVSTIPVKIKTIDKNGEKEYDIELTEQEYVLADKDRK